MFKFLLLFLIIFTCLNAKTMTAEYKVEFGIVGQVGKIHTAYSDNGKTYTIDTNLSAVGKIAKAVTSSLKERHISKGIIVKNRRIASSYEMIKSFGDYKSNTRYTVNHILKNITKRYTKWVKKGNKHKRVTHYSHILKYYAQDDMVSLFLNLDYHIKNKTKLNTYQFKAVGADKKNGRVDIHIPNAKNKKEMRTLLGKEKKGEWLMNLVMHRQLYNSKQGELMVRMGKDSTIEKAVLKDLIFFGDVRIIKQ